uniref:Chaperone protein dnaJ 15 n=1 Tax=Lepeophtheirus salmonis TaxID=72036 RepID=C1BSS8_LEPSM|nr:Chaperone protein dnaJ 15 [Lepeophtheirus salmonis]
MSNDKDDFYFILNVEKHASPSDIKNAYMKLARIYHPDKNVNDEEAVKKFQQISKVYAILSDPSKRKMYDQKGNVDELENQTVVNINELGTMSKMFFGFLNRGGLKVETQISPKVLSQAHHIANGKKKIDGEDLPSVQDVSYATEYKIMIQSQTAKFYRINITRDDLDHGVIIRCISKHSDKFKVIFFDEKGEISMFKESEYVTQGSEGNFFFFPFRNYHLKTEHHNLTKEKDIPIAFSLLESFYSNYESILPGNHLFCVYQNNWLMSGNCILSCLKVQPNHEKNIEEIKDVENNMQLRKTELNKLKVEFKEVKGECDEISNKLNKVTPALKEMISTRYDLYQDLFLECKKKSTGVIYCPNDSPNDSPGFLDNVLLSFRG